MAYFGFLKSMWPPFRSGNIDSLVFKLYCRCTVLILLVFSFVITCRLLFGHSFYCVGSDDFREASIYCYSHPQVIVVPKLSNRVGDEIAYPGISLSKTPEDKVAYIDYYPWVNLFFLVLAVMFWLPHLAWKVSEGGLMTRLTSKVNNTCVNEAERKAALVEIAKYMVVTRGGHLLYAGAYVIFEILNWLVAVVLTVCLVYFFNVSFSSEDFEMETWDDFFAYNFPLVAQCKINRYGASGVIQRHNFTCFLPLNKLHGYMFLFLFAWFITMDVIAALVLPCRILGILLPPIRLLLFRLLSGVRDQGLLDFINTEFSLGDWFLLTRLQTNLLPHDLTKLLIYVQQNFNKNSFDIEMDDFGKIS